MLAFTPHCDEAGHCYYSHPNVTHAPSCGVPHLLLENIFVTQSIMANTFTFEAASKCEKPQLCMNYYYSYPNVANNPSSHWGWTIITQTNSCRIGVGIIVAAGNWLQDENFECAMRRNWNFRSRRTCWSVGGSRRAAMRWRSSSSRKPSFLLQANIPGRMGLLRGLKTCLQTRFSKVNRCRVCW